MEMDANSSVGCTPMTQMLGTGSSASRVESDLRIARRSRTTVVGHRSVREGEPTISTGVRASSWFGWALAGVALLGLAVRVTYILGWHWGYHFGGDQYFYHAGANLLA